MKLDIIKVTAGLIIVLGLCMCIGSGTETTWRHSGFELCGFDINFTDHNASNILNLDASTILLSNDSVGNSDTYWNYNNSVTFKISDNSTPTPNDNIANALIYVNSAHKENSYGLNNIVSNIMSEDNTLGAAVAIAGSAQSAANGTGAWGGWFAAGQTGDTPTWGVEINTISQVDRLTIDNNSTFGLQISNVGTHNNTAGLIISKDAGGSYYNHGIYVHNAISGIGFANDIVSGEAIVLNTGQHINMSGASQLTLRNTANTEHYSVLASWTSGDFVLYNTTGSENLKLTQSGELTLIDYSGSGSENIYADSAGKLVRGSLERYGEAYIYNNAVDTVIETANTPIALRQISSGLVYGWTFDAGSTGAITAYADGTGGTVLVSDASHGLSNGDVITIRGTTNYNGVFTVSAVTTDTFKITDTWVNDNGASDWDQGASLTAGADSAGVYTVRWQMSSMPDAAMTCKWVIYINGVAQTKTTGERKFTQNDFGCCTSMGILDISAGDVVWIAIQSDGTQNVLNKHGNFNLRTV